MSPPKPTEVESVHLQIYDCWFETCKIRTFRAICLKLVFDFCNYWEQRISKVQVA
jgi:hypothetical protein